MPPAAARFRHAMMLTMLLTMPVTLSILRARWRRAMPLAILPQRKKKQVERRLRAIARLQRSAATHHAAR